MNLPKLSIFRDAQDITIVTLEAISTNVLSVASGTFSNSQPWGQDGAPTLSRTNVENRAPNSITSDARNNQIPNFPLYTPVTGCGSTVWGISSTDTVYLLCVVVAVTPAAGSGVNRRRARARVQAERPARFRTRIAA